MKRTHLFAGLACIASVAALSCQTNRASATDHGFTTAAAQVSRGSTVYANNCAKCHGASGEGKKGPALVGKEALPLRRPEAKSRTGEFRTADDIGQFVMHNMPPLAIARATISERDYWSVVAFALNANGVELTEPVGPNNAASIKIH